jgi:hypothetical protein
MQKAVVCFSPAVRESKQLWTIAQERSREVQGTNKHATMLPSRKHIKKSSIKLSKIVRALVACWGLEVRKHARHGQIGVWARSCTVAFIQVASSIYQGYTFRLPGYISKANMLLVSESG